MKRVKDDQVSRFIIKLGMDSELIKEMMDLHLNEDNINEFTSLDKRKASADLDKIMAYFEKTIGEAVSKFNTRSNFNNLLRRFIIDGGFDIENNKW